MPSRSSSVNKKPSPSKNPDPASWPIERQKMAEAALDAVAYLNLMRSDAVSRNRVIHHWLSASPLLKDVLAFATYKSAWVAREMEMEGGTDAK